MQFKIASFAQEQTIVVYKEFFFKKKSIYRRGKCSGKRDYHSVQIKTRYNKHL